MALTTYMSPETGKALGFVAAQHPKAGIELHWHEDSAEQAWLIIADYGTHGFNDEGNDEIHPLLPEDAPTKGHSLSLGSDAINFIKHEEFMWRQAHERRAALAEGAR
jgi:hypothetical protein